MRLDESNYDEGETFRNVALDDALNRSGRGADAGVRYAITPLTTLSVTAGFEEQTFKESHIRDLKRYTVGPTLEFSPEAAIRGRVVTAFELFKPDDPALSGAWASPIRRLLNWSLFGRTAFDLGAGRNISYSYQDTEPYYLLTNVRLLVSPTPPGTVRALRRLRLGAHGVPMATRRRLRRRANRTASTRLTAANGGVGIRLGRSFHLRIGVEKTRRRSIEEPLQNFSRTRILSTVTVGS